MKWSLARFAAVAVAFVCLVVALHDTGVSYMHARSESILAIPRFNRSTRLRCLVPWCDSVKYEDLPSREALWDSYDTGAPARQRQCVERYSIVKKI
jgi:hypothetical protein